MVKFGRSFNRVWQRLLQDPPPLLLLLGTQLDYISQPPLQLGEIM